MAGTYTLVDVWVATPPVCLANQATVAGGMKKALAQKQTCVLTLQLLVSYFWPPFSLN